MSNAAWRTLLIKLSWFWIASLLCPIILWISTAHFGAAIWGWVWMLSLAFILFWDTDEFSRGVFLFGSSVAIGIVGRSWMGLTAHPEMLDMVKNVMVYVFGGIGAGFMLAYFMRAAREL